MLLAMAWRNLWRSPWRTVILLLAVSGGLAGMVTNYGLIRGTTDRILEGMTSSVGHAQIHHEGYRQSRGTKRPLTDADGLLRAVRDTPGVQAAAGRIHGFAHASFVRGDDEAVRAGRGEDVAAPVVSLLGVEPVDEAQVTDLASKVRQGRWLEGGADVVVGAELAARRGIRLGDAMLPTAVDATGATRGPWAVSEEVPRVVGLLRTGVEDIDGSAVLLDRGYLSALLRMDDEVHEIAIRAESGEGLDGLVGAVRRSVQAEREADQGAAEVLASAPFAIAPAGAEAREEAVVVTARLVGVRPAASIGEAERPRAGLEGRGLARSEDVVLGLALAEALGVRPGDRVAVEVPVACGEGEADCPPSSEELLVAGIVAGDELLDGRFALVSDEILRGNVAALAPGSVAPLEGEDLVSAVALVATFRGEVLEADEVLAWYDLAPEIHQMLEMMDAAPIVFFVILYLAVILGIVNSMLMATYERTREIGLMRAVGMGPGRVVAMVLAESAILSLIGVAVGAAVGVTIVSHWSAHGLDLSGFLENGGTLSMSGFAFDPVLWPRVSAADVLKTGLTIATLTTLAGLWPAIRAARLRPTEALRQD